MQKQSEVKSWKLNHCHLGLFSTQDDLQSFLSFDWPALNQFVVSRTAQSDKIDLHLSALGKACFYDN